MRLLRLAVSFSINNFFRNLSNFVITDVNIIQDVNECVTQLQSNILCDGLGRLEN